MLLLGFGNRARQGKDLAAEAIRDYYELSHYNGYMAKPIRVGIFKFATALYQEVNHALKGGIFEYGSVYNGPKLPDWVQPDSNPEISELAPYGKHPKLLQFWGTEFRRAQDPNYWTDKLFASIPANLDVALVTDVRFLNEADGIKQRGGYVINVQRLREDSKQYFSSDRPVDHPSETALDNYNWDFKLVNSANHQALLAEQAITLCEYLRALGPSK